MPNRQALSPIRDSDLFIRLRRVPHRAMATTFECYIADEAPLEAQQVAEALFEEIDRIEQVLSFFIPSSNISRLNHATAGEPVQVGAECIDCLVLAQQVYRQSEGAFDPTVGACLKGRMRWDLDKNTRHDATPAPGTDPDVEQLQVGLDLIQVDPAAFTATRLDGQVQVDLGGIGKGYALDEAAIVLDDWGISTCLLSAGGSSFLPVGAPGSEGWPMRLLDPANEADVLGYFQLHNLAVSCSAQGADKHILDPKTRRPAQGWSGVWAVAPTAALADAWSTAFVGLPRQKVEEICCLEPDLRAILVDQNRPGTLHVCGDWNPLHLELL